MRAPARQIRRGDIGDAAALARLRYRFRADLDTPTEEGTIFLRRCEDWMADRLQAGRGWDCWVADAREELIGTVWLHTIEKIPNPVAEAERHGYITNLYVEPPSRGRGLGTKLLTAALEACTARRMDAIILWPTPESRRLYERHGFAVRDDLMERRDV